MSLGLISLIYKWGDPAALRSSWFWGAPSGLMLVAHGVGLRKGRGQACGAHLQQPRKGDREAAAGVLPNRLGRRRLCASRPVLRAAEGPGLTWWPQDMPLVAGPRATLSLESGGSLEAGRLLPSTCQVGVQTKQSRALGPHGKSQMERCAHCTPGATLSAGHGGVDAGGLRRVGGRSMLSGGSGFKASVSLVGDLCE